VPIVVDEGILTLAIFGIFSPIIIAILLFPLIINRNARLFYFWVFRKKPLLLIVHSNNVAVIEPAEYKAGNEIYVTRKRGAYYNTPKSTYLLYGGGTIAVAYDRYAATLPREMIIFAQKARETGIENIEEAEKKDLAVELPPPNPGKIRGETIRVQDIVGFFKYYLNPALLYATVERIEAAARAAVVKKQSNIPWLAIGIFIFLVLLGLAAVMMFSGGGGAQIPRMPIGVKP